MAILKHIAVKNSDYGQMQRYLLFRYDSHTQKPILDENGDMILREGYMIHSLQARRWFSPVSRPGKFLKNPLKSAPGFAIM